MNPGRRIIALGGCLLIVAASAGCAKRPVLYPNGTLEAVGQTAAEEDVQQCVELAKSADLDDNLALEAGKHTAGHAAMGTATGAVAGAISGRPGFGAAIGAATGAVSGFFSWMLGSSREPDPVFKRYVDVCLQERGYQVIGWD